MPEDRSPEEIAAGFEYDQEFDSVFWELPNGDRLVRQHTPPGAAAYAVARFGRRPADHGDAEPSWITIYGGMGPIPPESAKTWALSRQHVEPERTVIPPTSL